MGAIPWKFESSRPHQYLVWLYGGKKAVSKSFIRVDGTLPASVGQDGARNRGENKNVS